MDIINTRLLGCSAKDLQKAAQLLRNGELIAIPTETVYGLAANALDTQAVSRIFTAKGRPQDNPLIVHIACFEDLAPLVTGIPDTARKLANAFWPGPLTIILRRSALVPASVSAGLDTVAVRMPFHPVARAIIQEAGLPLAAPSANLSGSPSPTTAERVMADMNGRIAAVVDGGECSVGLESTVVDLTGGPLRLLRPGGVTVPALEAATGQSIEVDPAVTHALREGDVASSPGMKYKHYAPKAHVVLVKGSPQAYASYVNKKAASGEMAVALCFDEEEALLQIPAVTYGRRNDPADQAHRLFEALRRLDDRNASLVYAACPEPDGLGLAVYNRLLRAAGFEVISLD